MKKGIETTNIHDKTYGVPMNYHVIDRIEIDKNKRMTVTFAGYFSQATSNMLPLDYNALVFEDIDLSETRTVQDINDDIYTSAISDGYMFSDGSLVEESAEQ